MRKGSVATLELPWRTASVSPDLVMTWRSDHTRLQSYGVNYKTVVTILQVTARRLIYRPVILP